MKDRTIELPCMDCGRMVIKKVRWNECPPIAVLCYSCNANKQHLFRKRHIFNKTNGKCAYCGRELDPFLFERDHVIPLRRGGPHIPENIVAACARCNKRKNARALNEYRKYVSSCAGERLEWLIDYLSWAKQIVDREIASRAIQKIKEAQALLRQFEPIFYLDTLNIDMFMDGNLEEPHE